VADTSLSGLRVGRELDTVIAARGRPAMCVSDNSATRPWAIYAKLGVPAMRRDGTLRSLAGSAPRPVAPPSLIGSNDERALLTAG